MHQDQDPDDVLASVVHAAIDLIPGVEEGSFSIVFDRKNVTSRVPSGELPRIVDALQNETGQGPCLEGAYQERTVRVPDMSTEQRWPVFARKAYASGAGSMLAFQFRRIRPACFDRRNPRFQEQIENLPCGPAAYTADVDRSLKLKKRPQ